MVALSKVVNLRLFFYSQVSGQENSKKFFKFSFLLIITEKEERLAKEREEEAKNPEKKKV